MRIPFGISNNEKFGDGTRWEVQFSFQDEERSPSVQNFHQALDKVNNKVLPKYLNNNINKYKDWLDN